MNKMIILFLAVWAFVTGSIGTWRQLNGKERWLRLVLMVLLTGMLAGYAINSILHSKSESSEPEKTSSSSSSSSWDSGSSDSGPLV